MNRPVKPEWFKGPDRPMVERLLRAASLPTGDLGEVDFDDFLAVGSAGAPLGVVGLEIGGDVALLRSLVVDPAARGTGLGQGLAAAAEGFFARLGYGGASRETAPEAICRSREFAELCPASAAFMSKEVG